LFTYDCQFVSQKIRCKRLSVEDVKNSQLATESRKTFKFKKIYVEIFHAHDMLTRWHYLVFMILVYCRGIINYIYIYGLYKNRAFKNQSKGDY